MTNEEKATRYLQHEHVYRQGDQYFVALKKYTSRAFQQDENSTWLLQSIQADGTMSSLSAGQLIAYVLFPGRDEWVMATVHDPKDLQRVKMSLIDDIINPEQLERVRDTIDEYSDKEAIRSLWERIQYGEWA
jgi:hypothetical protein